MSSLKGPVTEQYLEHALAWESLANRHDLYAPHKADLDGFNDVAAVFRSTAESNSGHVHRHLEYLKEAGDSATGRPIGRPDDDLKAAIAGETDEHTDRCPGMARAARQEGSTRSPTGSRRSRRPDVARRPLPKGARRALI